MKDRRFHHSRTPLPHLRAALPALVLLVVTALPAGAAESLMFNKAAELPAVGLRLELFQNAVEAPQPSPQVFTYQFQQGDRRWKEDLYSPEELWRQRQVLGQWRDDRNNRLTLAVMEQRKPGGFSKPHARREEIEAALASAPVIRDAGNGDMTAWLKEFTGVEAALEPLPPSMRFATLLRRTTSPEQPGLLVYAWKFSPAMVQAGAPTNWFAAVFELGASSTADAATSARRAIELKFLPQVAFDPTLRTRAALKNGGPRTTTPFRPTAAKPGAMETQKSPEFRASREQALGSIRNLKDWWCAETVHYILLSNQRRGAGTLVDQLRENLELLRPQFEKCVPLEGPEKGASVIRMFATEKEYLDYVGPEQQWSSGLWNPQRKELLVRPIAGGTGRDQRERLLRIIYHEGFHQYAFIALDQVETSPWFNEGHATLFEAAEFSNGRIEVPESGDRVAWVDACVNQKRPLELERVTGLSYEQFYGGTDEDRLANYARAWALVYFLEKHAAPNHLAQAAILDRYLETLRKTRNAARANAAAFEGVDWRVLEADLAKFWKSPGQRTAARRTLVFRSSTTPVTPGHSAAPR